MRKQKEVGIEVLGTEVIGHTVDYSVVCYEGDYIVRETMEVESRKRDIFILDANGKMPSKEEQKHIINQVKLLKKKQFERQMKLHYKEKR